MSYGPDRAAMEAALARAHRALTQARQHAEDMHDVGAESDILQLEREVIRVAEGSLKGHRPKPQLKGQLRII